jgi:hypothetical protein
VDIWPEHDDPRVLIIYRGQLSPAVALPYTLTFTIPASGQVNAAAYRTADGQLLSAQYQYLQPDDRLRVSFTVPERGFQFEYYADLIKGRPQREFTAALVLPLPVELMRVAVEQPLRATAFTLTPPASGTSQTALGLTQHLYTVPQWPAGRPWTVRATYRKADETPSLPRVVRAPEPAQGAPRARAFPVWGWAALAAAALGLVSFGAFWVVRAREGHGPRTRAPARRAAQPSGAAYCPNCGHRARPGDRFCSRCGTELPRD